MPVIRPPRPAPIRPTALLAVLACAWGCGASVDPPLPDRERYAEIPPLPDASFWPKPEIAHSLPDVAAILRRDRSPVRVNESAPFFRIVDAEPSGTGIALAMREVTEQGELLRPDLPPEFGFTAMPGYPSNEKGAAVIAIESATPFSWSESKIAAKGVAVLLSGESDSSVAAANALRDVLTDRGYAVLASRAKRVPAARVEYAAGTMKEVTANARAHARVVDAEIASYVYAVEGMLEFFVARRADLRSLPIALVGVTEGAAVVPALGLRFFGRVGAAAMIGGGADLVALDAERYPEDRRVVLVHEGEAKAEDGIRWFGDVYSRDARLDPFAAAVWLRATPTSVVEPKDDAPGDVLFRKLDRPLRLQVGKNVDELLLWVRLRADRVLAFLFDPEAYRGEEPSRAPIEVTPKAELPETPAETPVETPPPAAVEEPPGDAP
jgi:hypothetical protein